MLRQLCLGRFPPIVEQYTFKCTSKGSIGGAGSLASHLLAALAINVLFCRQGVGGFGTDPQMTAVPSIASSACFHLKGSRRNCSLHHGLPPFSLPCPYWLHTNCVAYMKYVQVSAPGWCSERLPVHFRLSLSRWVNHSCPLGVQSPRSSWFSWCVVIATIFGLVHSFTCGEHRGGERFPRCLPCIRHWPTERYAVLYHACTHCF